MAVVAKMPHVGASSFCMREPSICSEDPGLQAKCFHHFTSMAPAQLSFALHISGQEEPQKADFVQAARNKSL